MNRTITLVLLASFCLCACNSSVGEVEISRDEYENLLEMAGEKAEESSDDSAPIETPSPTAVPDEDVELKEFESVDISQIDFENGDWFVLDFKKPDVQLLAPSYVKEWPVQEFDIHTSTEHSALYRDTDTITDGHLEGTLIRIMKKLLIMFARL